MRRATAVCIGNGIAEVISIHALRGESDPWLLPLRSSTHNFNPRPPRGERPLAVTAQTCSSSYFNPRPPRGERLASNVALTHTVVFQSTPSARRATYQFPLCVSSLCYFNPRPPRGERPSCLLQGSNRWNYFNPRPPRGERRDGVALGLPKVVFQSTPSARRATPIGRGFLGSG